MDPVPENGWIESNPDKKRINTLCTAVNCSSKQDERVTNEAKHYNARTMHGIGSGNWVRVRLVPCMVPWKVLATGMEGSRDFVCVSSA